MNARHIHVVFQYTEINNVYTYHFVSQDLIATFKSELSGHLKEAVVALCMQPADYDARSIHKAIDVSVNSLVAKSNCLTDNGCSLLLLLSSLPMKSGVRLASILILRYFVSILLPSLINGVSTYILSSISTPVPPSLSLHSPSISVAVSLFSFYPRL